MRTRPQRVCSFLLFIVAATDAIPIVIKAPEAKKECPLVTRQWAVAQAKYLKLSAINRRSAEQDVSDIDFSRYSSKISDALLKFEQACKMGTAYPQYGFFLKEARTAYVEAADGLIGQLETAQQSALPRLGDGVTQHREWMSWMNFLDQSIKHRDIRQRPAVKFLILTLRSIEAGMVKALHGHMA